jgi:hypothetical protein
MKDKSVFLFNPLTGNFDLALQFNENRIVTAEYNMAGSRYATFDSYSGTHIEDGPKVVVDNNGNVVVI